MSQPRFEASPGLDLFAVTDARPHATLLTAQLASTFACFLHAHASYSLDPANNCRNLPALGTRRGESQIIDEGQPCPQDGCFAGSDAV